ncbi:MAG: phenylalanine--tRNA ligase subunit alpha, partial [Stellaceae bacterium]
MDEYETYGDTITAEIATAASLDALEKIRIAALGRNGQVTEWMQALGTLPKADRATVGKRLNGLKTRIEEQLADATRRLEAEALEARLRTERIDITLPVKAAIAGRIHPISQTVAEVVAIFGEMGFHVAEGPHIEEDFYNFTALNMPPEHPARQEHDTFYFPDIAGRGERKLLRTHTSPVQIRT